MVTEKILIYFGIKRSKIKVTRELCQHFGPDTISLVVFNLQISYIVEVWLEEDTYLFWDHKVNGQGQEGTLSTLWELWEPLKNRRERRKLCLLYKIHNNLVPQLLSVVLSPMVRANTRNLRNNDDYSLPRYQLDSTEMSFFPSTIKL